MALGKISLARGIGCCPRPASLYCEECVCIYIHCDSVETVYALPLLPNKTASEVFLHKPEAVLRVDGKFIAGAPACQ